MSTVISLENVSKFYRLGLIGGQTLREDVSRWWAKVRGLPDPFLRIDEKDHQNQEGNYIWALRDINLRIEKGDVVGIVGRNGAGKSTLLKVLSKVSAPSTGAIKVKGRIASLLEVGTGFHPDLTGRENIFMNGAILGMSQTEIKKKFDEIVGFAGVGKFIDTPVKRYSSGMYVRLAFAVAAHLDPEILIVDEVLAVGDADFQKKCLSRMEHASKGEGRTVLFVSHNLAAVKKLCQRGILLNCGRSSFQGGIHEVVERYLNSSGYALEESLERKMDVQAQEANEAIIKCFSIVDESGKVADGALRQSRKYRVKIDFEVTKIGEEGLAFLLAFYNSQDDLIFVSDIHDRGPENITKFRKKGPNTVLVELPVENFLPKIYQVEFSCCVYTKKWLIAPGQKNRIRFRVEDDLGLNPMPSNINHPFTGSDRPGFIAPKLIWKMD